MQEFGPISESRALVRVLAVLTIGVIVLRQSAAVAAEPAPPFPSNGPAFAAPFPQDQPAARTDFSSPVPPAHVVPEPIDAQAPYEQIVVEEVPAWYAPQYWFGKTWTGSLELGLNGSDGNAQSLSLKAGGSLKRETKQNLLTVDLTHARTSTDSVDTQNNALGKFKHDHFLGDSPWSLFVDGSAEYDEFKAFDLRLASHAGLGYRMLKTDSTSLIGRFGSGVSHEIGGPDDDYVPEASFGLDFEHKVSDRQKLCIKAEYLPDWSDFTSYRVVTDVGWEVLVDAATNLHLKVSLIDRYDSTPNGLLENDVDYALLLLWKL